MSFIILGPCLTQVCVSAWVLALSPDRPVPVQRIVGGLVADFRAVEPSERPVAQDIDPTRKPRCVMGLGTLPSHAT